MKLEEIKLAFPCNVPWESMQGNDRTRFCDQCRQNVFNLSDMTRAEAESFLEKTVGTECIQFYKRSDGTVITADCVPRPVGHPPERPHSAARLGGVFRPDIVLKCPHCGVNQKHRPVLARLAVATCHACRRCFWRHLAKEVDEMHERRGPGLADADPELDQEGG